MDEPQNLVKDSGLDIDTRAQVAAKKQRKLREWKFLEVSTFVFQMIDFNFDIYKLIHGGKRYHETLLTWTHF